MHKKAKILGTIFGILGFILLICGITYAIYTWATIDTENKVIEANSTCFNVIYTKGNNIGSNEQLAVLNIGNSYKDGLSTTVKLKMDSNCKTTGKGTIYLNTTKISDILQNTLNYEVRYGSSSVAKGTIPGIGTIPIYENFDINTSEKSITVYVWLSGENLDENNIEEILKAEYKGNITASVESR